MFAFVKAPLGLFVSHKIPLKLAASTGPLAKPERREHVNGRRGLVVKGAHTRCVPGMTRAREFTEGPTCSHTWLFFTRARPAWSTLLAAAPASREGRGLQPTITVDAEREFHNRKDFPLESLSDAHDWVR